jgi:6-phosphogluconolactonase/glucosamine-6-phosphate isomerase/deaminase
MTSDDSKPSDPVRTRASGPPALYYGKTQVTICEDEFDLGRRAAAMVAQQMRELLGHREEIRMILAAGESQITFLDALAQERDLDWSRVVCFNMDDFWDVSLPEELTCGHQVRRQVALPQ